MAVYFQYKSSTVKESIPIEGLFTTVGELRRNILENKILRRGRRSSDSDIILSNYDTKEDYVDDATVIPRYATVLIRRVPLQSSVPIIVTPPPIPVAPEEPEMVEIDPEDLEWDELLNVINGTENLPPQSRSSAPIPTEVDDEDSRIKALVETRALDWRNASGSFSHGFGQQTPPPGYICHRCRIAGHFIKHCPTNGDPEYDIKRLRPATGIPKSMLVATPDGSYALPTGEVAVLRPNEAAFDKAMEGVPSSSRSVGQLPPELHCRLCKQVMKDAVLTSRCCFDSFCDRCIRNHIITKSSCVCGATNVLADDLIPNVTLRGTISSILESNSNSNSAEILPQKHESVSVKESAPAATQESTPLHDVEVEKKAVSDEKAEKKAVSDEKSEKKVGSCQKAEEKNALPVVTPYDNYMMSMGYNPYWGAYNGGYGYGYGYGPYGFGPMNMPFVEQSMKNSGTGFNAGPPEVRKVNEKRKRDDENFRSSAASSSDHLRRPRSDRHSTDPEHIRHRDHPRHHHSESTIFASSAETEKEEAALKKQKLSSSSNGYHESRKTSESSRKRVAYDDDDMHYMRRPSWYKSSPPATMKGEEERERVKDRRSRNYLSRSRDGWFPEGDRLVGRGLLA